MVKRPYNLAIETSGRRGSCSLGHGDTLIASLDLVAATGAAANHGQPPRPDNPLDLMVAIDRLTQSHQVDRSQLGQVYLSIGPGSFTGLRVAVTTAKAIARVLGVDLIAVPTIEVVAHNAPTQDPTESHLAVCLNYKRDSVYGGLFDRVGGRWQPRDNATVRTVRDLLSAAPRPLAIIADAAVSVKESQASGVRRLAPESLEPHSENVWRLGRRLAKQNRFIDSAKLVPLYARPPEAQRLWEQRYGPIHATPTQTTQSALS